MQGWGHYQERQRLDSGLFLGTGYYISQVAEPAPVDPSTTTGVCGEGGLRDTGVRDGAQSGRRWVPEVSLCTLPGTRKRALTFHPMVVPKGEKKDFQLDLNKSRTQPESCSQLDPSPYPGGGTAADPPVQWPVSGSGQRQCLPDPTHPNLNAVGESRGIPPKRGCHRRLTKNKGPHGSPYHPLPF